jgi:hypothetical protein
MTNKGIIFTFISIALIAFSCSRVPKDILSEKKMRDILYDMQIAEAMVETNYEAYNTSEKRKDLYDGVFFKHKITQVQYDTALIWYGAHMDIYMSIYKLVQKEINENIALLGDIAPNPLSGEASSRDSIDIWILKRSFDFNPHLLFNVLSFDILPKAPYSSGSSYVLGMNTWGVSPENKLIVRIYAEHADTTISASNIIKGDGYMETVIKTVATKQIKRVYGYVFLNDYNVYYRSVYLNDIKLMKYNYGSKAATAPKADSTDSIPKVEIQ